MWYKNEEKVRSERTIEDSDKSRSSKRRTRWNKENWILVEIRELPRIEDIRV